ncbi:reverse transcriptase domain-containing protein [Tanacetum coccineum]|uniref:Reverse transcriptase domain-containing protein n=1 Tax=Tanacetum coccineum TaxID=301880 RepID=A0ABQ5IYE0_9ASTR
MFTDGSSCVDGSGVGLILTNPEGAEFTYALRFRFDATNNEAEYEAFIAGLRIAEQMGVKNLKTNMDSSLVANQVNGSYIAKEPRMIQYLEKVKTLASSFKKFSIKQVPLSENKKAHVLANSVPLALFTLTIGTLPAERKKARAVWLKSRRYPVIDGVLYKKSYLGPWLQCVGPLQASYVTREIHEGSCSMHAGPRSVVAKIIIIGYYWPTMHKDARKVIRECQDCQLHCPMPRNPQQKLTPITSPWPFYKWRIDIAGPFPEGPDRRFASVKHLQANGLVERANKSLGEGVKARLDKGSRYWIEEFPHVLWAHRTKIKSSNGDTPFSLTYRIEVVIPAEIGMPTLWTAKTNVVQNDKALKLNLDLLEEKREQAAIHEARSKAKMEKYYNSKVCSTSFKPGDLVYWNKDASHTKDGGKLGPKWEGPYQVMEALGRGAYKLRDRNVKLLPRTWNARNLKKCYVHEM